jgi:hypothetical protein
MATINATDKRLTHDDVRRACGASGSAMEMTCPCCGHSHLQLFGEDGFDCKNGCGTATVAAEIRRLRDTGDAPNVAAIAPSKPNQPAGPPEGRLSLAEYGLTKHIASDILTQWFGVSEGQHPYYSKVHGVCFPYYNERGEELTQQWRWGMGGKNRRYLKDKPTYLYGGRFLKLLEQMAEAGNARREIFIVEGESNTHTLAQNNFPVLGLPGVSNWHDEWKNLQCLHQATRLYVFLDMTADGAPEEAAILGARKIADSFPPGKVLAVKLPFCKDVSELWLWHMTEALGGGIEGFRSDLQDAILSAQPIIPKREAVEGLPPDLGEQVFNACPILRDYVAMVLPDSETDVNNVVVDFLACAGAAIGLKAYAEHMADKHPAAGFHLLIGDTAIGKGTSFGCSNKLFKLAVPDWDKCVRRSARSQQSLYRMLGEVSAPEIVIGEGEEAEAKPNPRYTEGRMLLRSSEISAVFKSLRAEWSTLSQGLRDAYDGSPLSNERATAEDSIQVNSPYALAILGDVTPWELSEVIEGVDFANGVANRFIWSVARRTKTIPRAKGELDFTELAARLHRVIPATTLGKILFSADGEAAWDTWVYSLPLDDGGKLGSACGRQRANALRLAVLFAVLDETREAMPKICARHVQAAAAVINRHRLTVAWFLARPARIPSAMPEKGKSKVWQQIEKVRAGLKNGRITGAELYKLFSNQTQDERTAIAQAAGLIYMEERDEKGNKVGVWS